jgi:hypothetical protein
MRTFVDQWDAVASEAIEVMAESGNPQRVNSRSTEDDKPLKIFAVLGGLSKLICRGTSYRQRRFEDRKLWEFIEWTRRWCCGDQIPEVFVRARGLYDIAMAELDNVAIADRISRVTSSCQPVGGSAHQTGEINGQADIQKTQIGDSERKTQELESAKSDTPANEDDLRSFPTAESPTASRLHTDPLTRTISLDGNSITIKNARVFGVFCCIADAAGALVRTQVIREKVPGCRLGRIDQLLRTHLPKWVRDLIPGQTGPNGGYALLLPENVRNGARSTRNRT